MATETARAIEAILMVADQPVPPQLLAQLLELQIDQITAVLDELMASYEVEDRGFILTKIAGGYRFQSHPDLAPYVERFVLEGQSARLSAAALETLAIIAYKQPISRAQVAQVRGVNVDGVVKTLEQRGYIAEIGRDPGPGNPSLFGTTDAFLEKLGLASLADLPPIAGFVPGPDVVEQLEQGLRAEIDAETAAYVADLAERADEAAAEESGDGDGDGDGDGGDGDGEADGDGNGNGDAAATAAVVVSGSIEVIESADGDVVETIEVVDTVEVDDAGDVIETTQVIDDTIAVGEDGHVVEVVDTVTETVVVTPEGDVVDVVDETVVVVADGELVGAVDEHAEDVVRAEDLEVVDTPAGSTAAGSDPTEIGDDSTRGGAEPGPDAPS